MVAGTNSYKPSRQDRREQLQTELETIIGSENKVYYEPPENIKMTYPCIVLTRQRINAEYADNKVYNNLTRYKITYIDYSPDSDKIDDILTQIKGISPGDHFVFDGLHHDVFYTDKY